MENLRDIIRAMAASGEVEYCVPAKVTSVDKDANTCDCEPLDGSADLVEIRLQAGAGKGWVLYPVVGSVVIVSFLSKDDGYVSMFSEVEKYALETQNESLKKLLEDFITEVSNLVVTTNMGASINVVNKPALDQIKTRVGNLFSK